MAKKTKGRRANRACVEAVDKPTLTEMLDQPLPSAALLFCLFALLLAILTISEPVWLISAGPSIRP